MKRMFLKDCCAFDRSKQLDAASIQELVEPTGDIRLLPSSKDYDWKTTRAKAGSFVCRGPIITMGKARYANIKYCPGEYVSSNNMLIKPRDDKSLNCRYLFYFLKRHSAKAYVMGTTYPKFDLNRFNEMTIPTPSLNKQEAAAFLFDSIEEQINGVKTQISLLDEQVKSLFNEAFINAAYPRVAIKTVCSKITDGTHKTPVYQNEGVRFISAKNISSGKLDLSDVKHITQEEYETIQKRCQLAKGDVLLAKSGTLGVSVLFEENGPFGLFESLAVLKPIPDVLDGRYLSEAIGSAFVQEQFSLTEVGVGVKHLHLNVISNTVIPLPPIDVQKAFANQLQQIDKLRFKYQRQIELLNELMEKKMEEYFGGEENA